MHHHSLDWQAIPGEYEGIENGGIAMPNQHWIIVVQRDQVGGSACLQARFCSGTRLDATRQRTQEQLAANV